MYIFPVIRVLGTFLKKNLPALRSLISISTLSVIIMTVNFKFC